MVTYLVKTPSWLKNFFPKEVVWDMPDKAEPTVYLTFDDGPHPLATPFVLDQLSAAGAKATFFCVGNNVAQYPELYRQMIAAGHATANHTYNHVNGWKTDNEDYMAEIQKAANLIHSDRFRPPYGRARVSQMNLLLRAHPAWKIYMWDIISGDFDKNISAEQCTRNVTDHLRPGSIVVFHDSQKAWDRLSIALPEVLKFCTNKGWQMKALP